MRFEEHMFVKMRQTVEFGRFGKRTVANGDFDRDQRHGFVGQNDDFKTVRQNLVDKRNFDALLFGRGSRRRSFIRLWICLSRSRDEVKKNR